MGRATNPQGQAIQLSKLRQWKQGFDKRLDLLLNDPVQFMGEAVSDVVPTQTEMASWWARGKPQDDPVAEKFRNIALSAKIGGEGSASQAFRPRRIQTVADPVRMDYPGIYKDPRELATTAEAMVAPESPALKRLFGVTRQDLYDISQAGRRAGNINPPLPGAAPNPKGSAAASQVMTGRNEARLLNALEASRTYAPRLRQGMMPWYVMDPAYERMVQLLGPQEAARRYEKFNALTGMASPGSETLTELNRGSAANWLHEQGRFEDFLRYGGMPESQRGANFPSDMRSIIGHPYHSTAQARPMRDYLTTGSMQMESPKVPMYIHASGVPATGFQTRTPVGDAHWSRAVGLADVRTNANSGASVSTPEMQQLKGWWRKKIATPSEMESVPGQALAWGLFSPQTGVSTPIGAPKLELLANQIMRTSNRLGVTPERARDMVLTGQTHAGRVDPDLLWWMGAGGASALGAPYYLWDKK